MGGGGGGEGRNSSLYMFAMDLFYCVHGNKRGCDRVTPDMADSVNHPAHYGGEDNPYEAIKVIEAWELGFNTGNAVKYISRAGKKDPAKELEDLQKAVWYLEREVTAAAQRLGRASSEREHHPMCSRTDRCAGQHCLPDSVRDSEGDIWDKSAAGTYSWRDRDSYNSTYQNWTYERLLEYSGGHLEEV